MGASTRLLLALGGLLAANCLIWGTFLAVCGACAVGRPVAAPEPPPATAVTLATAAPPPLPSPSPTQTPRPTRTPTPTRPWIVNPTASWPTTPRPSPTFTRPPATATPWPTQVIEGAGAEGKGQALLALAARGPGIPFRVVFTEGEIEEMIAASLAQQPEVPARNVRVAIRPGEVVLAGQVRAGGLWLDATVHGNVTARDGKLVATVTQVELGRVSLPPAVQADLNRQLTDALTGLDALPFQFTAITLGTGRITLQGVTK